MLNINYKNLLHKFKDLDIKPPKKSHWYLQVIVTEPAHHGQEIGSAVLESWLM